MRQYVWTAAIVTCLLAFCSVAESRSLAKRQTEGINIDPLGQEAEEGSDDSGRDKRKVDAVTGVKSAVLGFVFNKLNSFIDQKTAWIDALDHTNIAKNKAHNIEPPKDPILSLSSIISGVIGQKLQAASPLIGVVTNKLTSGSSGGGHTGFNFGSLLSGGLGGGLHGGLGGGLGAGTQVHAGANLGGLGAGASLNAGYGVV